MVGLAKYLAPVEKRQNARELGGVGKGKYFHTFSEEHRNRNVTMRTIISFAREIGKVHVKANYLYYKYFWGAEPEERY